MNLLEHFELHPVVEIHLFGIDLSITNAVVMMWVVAALLFLFLTFIARKISLLPSRSQSIVEMIFQYIYQNLVIETLGKEGGAWFPFIATLFFFIFFCNIFGLIPGAFTATSNINVTATLAILVFLIVQSVGIYKHGVIGYLKGLVPGGIPIWIAIMMFPIELLSQFAKPFSLAVRLFANMLAGHVIILVFLSLILNSKSYIIGVVPMAGVVLMNGLEIFFGLIQAYVFALLTALYISAAVHIEH